MPDPQPQQFQPMDQGSDPHNQGNPRANARDIASQAAAEAVRGTSESNTASPGTRFDSTVNSGGDQGEPLPSETSQHVEAEPEPVRAEPQEPQEPQPQAEPQEAEPQAQPRQPGELTDDEFAMLEERGIEIPVDPTQITDPDARSAVAQMAQRLADTHDVAQETVEQAKLRVEQVKDFSERLQTEEGQQRLLLGVALNNPEVFTQAAEMVQRMQQDEDYAQSVRRDLEAQVKLEAVERKERALRQSEITRKATQVENRAVRRARQLGVDEGFAKEQVANRILQNEARTGERDITLAEVDQVVQGLADRVGARKPQRAKSPQTQEREAQANTQRTQGTGEPQPADQDTGRAAQPGSSRSRGQDTGPMDNLRAAVRSASERARSKGL